MRTFISPAAGNGKVFTWITGLKLTCMAALKTTPTGNSVAAFLDGIPAKEKREDAYRLMALMEAVTCSEGRMWGAGIVGFGDTLLKYESGRKLNWFIMGFSPRKQNFALYIPGAVTGDTGLLHKLGHYKTGKGCLYINKWSDVDAVVLRKICQAAITLKQ